MTDSRLMGVGVTLPRYFYCPVKVNIKINGQRPENARR